LKVSVEEDEDAGEATCVVSDAHVLLDPLKSVTTYGAVPPVRETVADTVADCPESIAAGDRKMVAESDGLTVTSTLEDVDAVSCGVAASATVAQ
jgi:hypothetical protein